MTGKPNVKTITASNVDVSATKTPANHRTIRSTSEPTPKTETMENFVAPRKVERAATRKTNQSPSPTTVTAPSLEQQVNNLSTTIKSSIWY